ncbi:coiled-coil domain-containing glutamate-rich protein 2 [Pelodiscus sinensis]|uniref:coiled-coil domain-containing glutamate-rich protein 2 n=1 Tax=Pelodiscus sinensis TaxID=13735 RepID=UPI003F6CC169
MLALGLWLLLGCWPAHSLPLSTQRSEEEEKVIRCITDVLADTLAKPSPVPVASDCLKVLKKDERVLAMLHHHYLLKELRELVHEENAAHPPSRGAWPQREEGPAGDALRKRDETVQEEREQEGEAREEYEKTERVEEKVKEEKVSHGAGSAQELAEGEEEEERKRGHEEARRAAPKARETRGPGARKKTGPPAKRHVSMEDSSEEERTYHPAGQYHGGHEAWEEEEEEDEEKRSGPAQRKGSPAKRMAEKASDEETAQFEAEEKGVKISDSRSRLHGDRPLWQGGEEPPGWELEKRHHEAEGSLKGKHRGREEEEEEEEEREAMDKEREPVVLAEIEHALKKVVEKLRELRRG